MLSTTSLSLPSGSLSKLWLLWTYMDRWCLQKETLSTREMKTRLYTKARRGRNTLMKAAHRCANSSQVHLPRSHSLPHER